MAKSDLPFSSEFSPSQISLKTLLELARRHGGDADALQSAIRKEYFDSHETGEKNRRTLAYNARRGMTSYGVSDESGTLTEFGNTLYELRNDEDSLYDALGKQILLHLNGSVFVQCILDMHASGQKVDLLELRRWLAERGIHFPRGGKHPSIMRLWLEKARVFVDGWRVDEDRLHALIGVSVKELEALTMFTREQRAYLRTLANVDGPGPFKSNDIEKLAAATYGVHYNEKNLPKSVLYPIRDAGYVTIARAAGRGSHPFLVTPTDKFNAEVLSPLLEQIEQLVRPELRPILRKPLSEILEEVKSKDKHIGGLALEALAFKLMRLIDLDYLATRLRGTARGGAEVDLIFESTRLVFSRWQIQCKRTDSVSLEDVAKEVGLTHLLKSNVIVMVSTGKIGSDARRYANRIMTDSNMCIVMIDRDDIKRIESNPTVIVDVFRREAKHAMEIKRIELYE